MNLITDNLITKSRQPIGRDQDLKSSVSQLVNWRGVWEIWFSIRGLPSDVTSRLLLAIRNVEDDYSKSEPAQTPSCPCLQMVKFRNECVLSPPQSTSPASHYEQLRYDIWYSGQLLVCSRRIYQPPTF